MLDVLQAVHDRFILHRDLKPENIMFDHSSGRFSLIDFGLSKRYVDRAGNHILRTVSRPFRGTLRYCSLNMHNGVENTRRDDLESLAYVLVYLVKSTLPWVRTQGRSLQEKMEAVRKTKLETKPTMLCQGLDSAFCDLLVHARTLNFTQTPDYSKLRASFRAGLRRLNKA